VNNEDEISKLREEVERLSTQLHEQQQLLSSLRRRLTALGAPPVAEQSPGPSYEAPHAKWSLENFIGLRLIQVIGIIVLVIGLSIGVKYAIDVNLISEAARIGLAYAAGILIFLLSIRLRKRLASFSAVLFSGAMASLYFTTYGAFVYYNMFPFGFAYAIMVLLTVFTVYQAIRYNQEQIALLGLVGAYAIPFLISKNSERADLFFLYIALINSGIVYLSIRRHWRRVYRLAFLITWILFLSWAIARFDPHLHGVGFFFLSFFFLLFLFNSITLRQVSRQPFTITESQLIFANNIAFCLGALYLSGYGDHPVNLAMIAFLLSLFVGVQGAGLHIFWKEEARVRNMVSVLALSLFLLSIAAEWSGVTVTLLWLLVAIVLFIAGIRMKSVTARLISVALMGFTLLKLVALDSLTFTTIQKIIAYLSLGVLLLVVSFYYQRFKESIFKAEE
jgi:uncharacterized membrane protein